MSSDDVSAEIIAVFATTQSGWFVECAAITLFAYDFAITFNREVQYFWKRSRSLGSILFLSIRYCYLMNCIVILLGRVLHPSVMSCNIVGILNMTFELSVYLPFAVFSGTRAYALCRSWLLSALISVFSLAPLCINIANSAIFVTPGIDPIFGCGFSSSIDQKTNTILTVTSRGPLIIADFLLVVITWRTVGQGVLSKQTTRDRRTFSGVLLWNGTLYFVVIFILNTLHLIFSITSIFQAGDGATSNLSVFIDPLTTILIYRFILDLQAANAHNVRIGSQGSVLPTPTQTQSTLGFVNRTVGSLASTIISGAVSAHTEDGLDESYDDSPGHTMQLLTPDYSADAAALEPMPYVREDL